MDAAALKEEAKSKRANYLILVATFRFLKSCITHSILQPLISMRGFFNVQPPNNHPAIL